MITKTFEPLRPLCAPDGGSAHAALTPFTGWLVHYGESWWPSWSY